MDLERVTAVIRPRGPWEAVDLGFRMVLADARRVYAVVGLIMLPLYALITAIAAFAGKIEFAMPVLWWLKPMFDRIVLALVSRSLFGDKPGLKESLRVGVRAMFGAGLVQALTLYRLDPARSLNLPVWQLEQLRGRRRWQRARILHRDTWGVATLLTTFCVNLEIVALVGVFACIGLLIPPELDIGMIHWVEFFTGSDQSVAFMLLYVALYGGIVWLVEPLFAAGGFALYLNRRTILEAWDIELAFRRLAARYAPAPIAAALLAALCLPALLVSPAPVQAQNDLPAGSLAAEADDAQEYEQNAERPGGPDVEALIAEVLAHPDFDAYETIKEWDPHYREDDAEADDETAESEWVLNAIARGSEVLVWLAVVGLALFLWVRRDWLRSFFQPPEATSAETPQASPLHSPVPQAASLPADIPAAVQALWREGKLSEAVSLLYRGAIRELKARHHITLGDDATESDWLSAARLDAPASVADFFGAITRTWQYTAYARQTPGADKLMALCTRWPDAFGDKA
ncbi:MAG: hypothetical protein AAFN78_10385 [Pseudomonadota bacterium]